MKLLFKLIDALGPSGYEKQVRDIIMREIKRYVDEVKIDKFGNLIAIKKGIDPKVMLAAHMDEVGLMVKSIKENGLIEFTTLGGIEPISLVAQRVDIITEAGLVRGVISFSDLHEEYIVEELPKLKDLYIDTGLNKEQLESMGVRVGDYIIPKHRSGFLGSRNIIYGKALDNRIGCYILLELAKKLRGSKETIYYVFTVQEEIGLYGAQTSIYNLDPDWGIAVDTTNSEDASQEAKIKLGDGPRVTVKDAEMISNKCLNDWLRDIANKNKIPVKYEVAEVGATDAAKIILSKGGVPSTVVAVPVRNIHTTVGVAHADDINNAIILLYELLKKPPRVCLV